MTPEDWAFLALGIALKVAGALFGLLAIYLSTSVWWYVLVNSKTGWKHASKSGMANISALGIAGLLALYASLGKVFATGALSLYLLGAISLRIQRTLAHS